MKKAKAIIVSGYFNPLHKGHLELFEKAKEYEKRQRERYDMDVADKRFVGSGTYTWSQAGTLDEVVAKAEKRRAEKGIIASSSDVNTARWQDVFKDQDDDDPEDQACLICSL